jgi:cell shape-determining protein MreD
LFSGLFFGVSVGVETGLACGVIRDLLEIGVFGRNILFFGVLGLVTGFLSDRVYKNNAWCRRG